MASERHRATRRTSGGPLTLRALVGVALIALLAAVGAAFAVSTLLGSEGATARPDDRPLIADVSAEARAFTDPTPATTPSTTDATPTAWTLRAATLAAIPPSRAVTAGGGTRREVALTFDDGPSPFTPKVLGVLRAAHAHATFFVVGRNVAANPHWTDDIVRAGDEIGDHTWSHASIPALPAPDRRSEILGPAERVHAITEATPVLFRPPYGAMNPATNRLTRDLGLVPVVWSVDPHDYDAPSAKVIAQRVLARVHPGSIVLLHDGGGDRRRTVAALRQILRGLRALGLRPVTVSELLNGSPPGPRELLDRM
jgi:peptidoglycan/xylan/chitin deacetylase (PgdA/CDA1 family)